MKYAWAAWAALFVVLEGIGLFDRVPNDTLTETIHHAIPGWAFFAFAGWAAYHFLRTYLENRNGR